MPEELKMLAARIKGLREINGVSVETLAKELGVSKDLLLAYESGETDIPVGILFKIAKRFGVELSSLLTGEEPKLRTYAVTRNGKGVSVERRRDYKYQSLAYNFINKKIEPFLVTVEPEPELAPVNFNSHPGQEFNYVLEGTLKVILNGYEVLLNEGDALFFDSNVEHGMKAMGGRPAKFLAVIVGE
ncbi:MAG: helix-turn-helix domain-containing protein [Firmicutes bacterium]|nr:helix-turn-helix domain-containing protein [Bacillota bacterium]